VACGRRAHVELIRRHWRVLAVLLEALDEGGLKSHQLELGLHDPHARLGRGAARTEDLLADALAARELLGDAHGLAVELLREVEAQHGASL
jgi:hypothetical protein